MTKLAALLIAVAGVGLELWSGAMVVGLTVGPWHTALGMHVAAAALSAVAAATSGAHRPAERLATAVTAVCVPVFGPALAWTFRMQGVQSVIENAHARFERLEDAETYERSTLTGDFETDLAREVGTVSFAQILRSGSRNRRRNLLRSLRRLGTPEHVAVIRGCLLDDDPELRLCAHAELEHCAREHEERIAELRQEVEDGASDGAVLAEACREYAHSGVFDSDMAHYWLERAEDYARNACEAEPGDRHRIRRRAEILVELGRLDEAAACLDAIARTGEDLESDVVRAEIAFYRRDFETICAVAHAFEDSAAEVPAWIAAIAGVHADAEEAVE